MAKRQTEDKRALAPKLYRVIILYENCRCLLPTGVQQQLDEFHNNDADNDTNILGHDVVWIGKDTFSNEHTASISQSRRTP
jgi:hypothetical protein